MAKRFILIIFIALLIFSAIYALWDKKDVTTSSDLAYQVYIAGTEKWKNAYLRDAIPEFERAVKIDTNFAMSYAHLAELYNYIDRKEEAGEMMAKAMTLLPLVTEREQLLIKITDATINTNLENQEKLIDEYVEKFPDDIFANHFEAKKFMLEKDFDNAINEYEKIIDRDPAEASAYNMLGYLNYYVRNYDNAMSYLKKYSILAKKEANPHDSYGEILMNLGRYDEAIREFETANRIKPDLDFVLYHLGAVHREIGRYRDAIGYIERAKEHNDSRPRQLNYDIEIAYNYFLAGKTEIALEILKDVLKEKPDRCKALSIEGIVFAHNKDFDSAAYNVKKLDSLKTALKDSPTAYSATLTELDLQIASLQAAIAFYKEDYRVAIEKYQYLVEQTLPPHMLVFRYLLGRSYNKAGEPEKAIKELLANLEDNPNHAFTLFELSQIYKNKEDNENYKQYLLKYLSVMSGADESVKSVITARAQLDSLVEM
ncbi:MAG: tetratricopeptide repeat protein [candidate division Zixibacteria bacterium]|nr:tetratricopeptide repeat protein [candidate division Zixibacteria bacterium]